jgi:hypothetical protein
VFATIGQLSHDHHVSAGGYAADALPLAAGWLAFAALTRRFVPTRFGGVTLGVAIRMVALGHYRWSEIAFLAVALVFVGFVAFLDAAMVGRASRFAARRRRSTTLV